MDIEEIKRYCKTSSGVCVYRKRVKKAQFLVQSITIRQRKTSEGYYVVIEFDPMSMVDMGEGIQWTSHETSLDTLVNAIEEFSGGTRDAWENFTRTGQVPFYDSEEVTNDHYLKSWDTFAQRYANGQQLLPKGLEWESPTKDPRRKGARFL